MAKRATGGLIENIRRAVASHHGGFDTASDEEIMSVWQSLTTETQERYIAEQAARVVNDA